MKTLAVSVLMISSLAHAGAGERVTDHVVDRIVAVVGGEIITAHDQVGDTRPLDELIDDQLIAAEADRRHISAGSDEVQRALDEVMRSNNLTAEQLWKAVADQHFTEAGYRRRLRRQLVEYKLLNVLAADKPAPAKGAKEVTEDSQARLARMAEVRKAQLITARANTPVERRGPSARPTTPPVVCRKATGALVAVEVRGQHRVDGKGICTVLQHPAGGAIDAERAHQDLVALWKTNAFDDVVVETTGGTLSYVVHERPLVSKVTYAENAALSALEMHSLSAIRPGDVVAPNVVQRAANRLTDELIDRGYQRAAVKGEVHPDGAELVRVHFLVTPGVQVSIGAVRFAGNQRVSTDELLGTLGRSKYRLRVGSVYRSTELDAALQTLLAYYYDHGMVQARIDAAPPSPVNDAVTIEIRITEGPVYHLGTIRFVGTAGPDSRYVAAAALTSGAVFSRAEVRAAAERIEGVHHALGGVGSAAPETNIHDNLVDILWRLGP